MSSDDAPRRGPLRWVRFAAALAIGAAMLASLSYTAWQSLVRRLTHEERPLVGGWRIESDSLYPRRPGEVSELDLLPSGIALERIVDVRTGVATPLYQPAKWRVAKGRLQVYHGGNNLPRWVGGDAGYTGYTRDQPITWESPERFRLEATSNSGTIVWVQRGN